MPTADEKRRLKEIHDKFLQDLKKKQQEVVMKFKRSNDAVLSVYVPQSFNGQGCIDCAADHNVRSKFVRWFELLGSISYLKDGPSIDRQYEFETDFERFLFL